MERLVQQLNTVNASPTGRFSRETAAGYDRRIIEDSQVVLVGCGALGQFVALILALIGFAKVIFVDMDNFEESNISRSPFYREGWNKAKATAIRAHGLCTALGPLQYAYAPVMIQTLGHAIFADHPRVIVFCAVDSQPARRWLAWCCRAIGVPLIEGGFHGNQWNLSVFPNHREDEPCWSCDRQELAAGRIFSCDTYARQTAKAGLIPATAPCAAVLGAWQVEAGVACLHGDRTLDGHTVFGDLRKGATRLMQRTVNPHCSLDHRILAGQARRVTCGPENTAADLLAEVARLVHEPVIELPASFIRTAPCFRCHHSVRIEMPEWALNGPPLCRSCGGLQAASVNDLPEQHGSLSVPTSETIQGVPLGTLGLGPGMHLSVSGRDKDLIIRLAGQGNKELTTVGREEGCR